MDLVYEWWIMNISREDRTEVIRTQDMGGPSMNLRLGNSGCVGHNPVDCYWTCLSMFLGRQLVGSRHLLGHKKVLICYSAAKHQVRKDSLCKMAYVQDTAWWAREKSQLGQDCMHIVRGWYRQYENQWTWNQLSVRKEKIEWSNVIPLCCILWPPQQTTTTYANPYPYPILSYLRLACSLCWQ